MDPSLITYVVTGGRGGERETGWLPEGAGDVFSPPSSSLSTTKRLGALRKKIKKETQGYLTQHPTAGPTNPPTKSH
jgi:hypothetical protein